MDKAKTKNVQIHLPIDFVVADKFAEDASHSIADLKSGISEGHMVCHIIILKYYILDLGA